MDMLTGPALPGLLLGGFFALLAAGVGIGWLISMLANRRRPNP